MGIYLASINSMKPLLCSKKKFLLDTLPVLYEINAQYSNEPEYGSRSSHLGSVVVVVSVIAIIPTLVRAMTKLGTKITLLRTEAMPERR